MPDPPAEESVSSNPRGRRARRQMFTCAVCHDVFIDADSFEKHKLTHQAEGASAAEPVPASATLPAGSPAPAPGGTPPPPPPVPRAARATPHSVVEPAPAAPIQAAAPLLEEGAEASGPPDPETIAYWQSMLEPPRSPPGFDELHPPRKLITLEDFAEWVVLGMWRFFKAVSLAVLLVSIPAALAIAYFRPQWVFGAGPTRPRPKPVLATHSTPQPSAPHPLGPPTAARKALLAFIRDLNARAYRPAYQLLTPDWRHELSYARFKAGYRGVRAVRGRVLSERKLPSGKMSIGIEVTVVGQNASSTHAMEYVVKRTPPGWRLESATARR